MTEPSQRIKAVCLSDADPRHLRKHELFEAVFTLRAALVTLRDVLDGYPLHLAEACVGSHDVAVHQAWVDGLRAWQAERAAALRAIEAPS